MTKTCPRCALVKPVADFAVRKRSPNPDAPQYASWCKSCNRETLRAYSKQEQAKYRAGELAPKWIGKERSCITCHGIFPVTDFYAFRGRPSSYCKPCQRAYYEANYKSKPGYKTAKARVRSTAARAELSRIKSERGCEVCGEREPVCLDFHHRDPGSKRFTISKASGGRSLADLLAEVEGCAVLCANCHRKQHHAARPSRAA